MADKDWPAVTVYTDGACDPNPGPGGWAAILVRAGEEPVELCGREAQTTNNRMELRAALEALQALPEPHSVTVVSDSQYLVQGIAKWTGRPLDLFGQPTYPVGVPNEDLWRDLAREAERHRVRWEWVRGHSGNEWNDRADALASAMLPGLADALADAKAIHVFTAASCPPGPSAVGGWGVVLRFGERVKELSGQEPQATTQRLHLRAALRGLAEIKQARPVRVYTTSDYLRNGMTAWARTWQAQGWRTAEGKPVLHPDLWQQLLQFAARYTVSSHLVPPREASEAMTRAKQLAEVAARTSSQPAG